MTVVLPFPNPKTTLKLHFVKDILKKDITADAAEALFTSHREEFDLCLRNWKYDLERSLVKVINDDKSFASLLWKPQYPELYGKYC